MPTIARNLINAGDRLSRQADKSGDKHNPVGEVLAAAAQNFGDIVKGGTKAVMGADYAFHAVQNGYGALTDAHNTFLGYQAQELPTRGLELAAQGVVAYTAGMIALEGVGQVASAIGHTIEDAAKRARSVD